MSYVGLCIPAAGATAAGAAAAAAAAAAALMTLLLLKPLSPACKQHVSPP
jgi:hypothetical protein